MGTRHQELGGRAGERCRQVGHPSCLHGGETWDWPVEPAGLSRGTAWEEVIQAGVNTEGWAGAG